MKTALVYSHKAVKTSQVAKMIKEFTSIKSFDDLDVEKISPAKLTEYNLLILGAPTWFDGELPSYWDEMVPAIEDLDFSGVKVAIFGNGDQVGYPENFGDAVGLLAQVLENSGATINGLTSTEGYSFESSKALHNKMFRGLVLDFENQSKKNKERIKDWLKSIEA